MFRLLVVSRHAGLLRARFFSTLLLCAAAAWLGSFQTLGAATPKSSGNGAEAAIRLGAAEFTKAFNAGDAKAIGVLWADDAEYTDEAGTTFRGRKAIEGEYAALFKQHPGATLTLTIESIRMLGDNVAIEKGIAKSKSPKENVEVASRYTVVHAKREGKWLMEVGHDSHYVPVANDEYLKDLEFLIGDWTPDSKDAKLHVQFEWLAQKNFIKVNFSTMKEGKAVPVGVQIIGWNPKLGKIVAWHFNEEGGFGTDIWTKDDTKWVIEASGLHRDGSESSSVNILTATDAKSFQWQSVRRTLDGVRLPDSSPIKFVKSKDTK